MNKFIFILIAGVGLNVATAQEKYQVTIDLTKTENDRIPVEVHVPNINKDIVAYHIPKIVPGTYSISDFGRFIVDFKALDSAGNELKTVNQDINKWIITNAKSLDRITYWVEDSFDEFPGYNDNKIFESAGINIEVKKKIYVINTFGCIGYLDEMKFYPYDLTIHHDVLIKGATSLNKISESETSDTYVAENFNFLADAPIMYSEPDIVTKEIAGASILVSVYSPNNKLSASDVMDTIDELMEVQAMYLGGKLPVDRYAYLIYLFDKPSFSGGWGALEHSYSSLYTLPEANIKEIGQIIKNVVAHEFFHIVTPLNIHSEEIHDFDYIDPEMSQHLWLYEGVTEYEANHVQVKYNLYSIENFLEEMKNKMYERDQFGVDIPYTEFSKNILEPQNAQKYGDVYSGGALIAMCLDLTIIKSTEGKMDLQSLLRTLSKQYGPMKAFKDEDLFDEIENITTPLAGDFLRKHVGDTVRIPFKEILNWAGIEYSDENDKMIISAGNFTPDLNDKGKIFVSNAENLDDFGKALGIKQGDIIISWNGDKMNVKSFEKIIEKHYFETNEGDDISVIMKREIEGKNKKIILKAKAISVKSPEKYSLSVIENPSSAQQKIRSLWLENE